MSVECERTALPFVGRIQPLVGLDMAQAATAAVDWNRGNAGMFGMLMQAGQGTWKEGGGFSLIELMVTVAVLAVLVTVALPSFTSTINGNRLVAQANDLVAMAQLARSEAIRANGTVRLCRTADGSSCAGGNGEWNRWLVVSGGNVVQEGTAASSSMQVTAGAAEVTFRPDGTSGGGTLTACLPTTRPQENQRVVSISTGGRVSVASGSGTGECP